jgi:hypothetical protein
MSSINVNSLSFDPSWKHNGKSINEFIGIELKALFSSRYSDNESEMTLFSLKDEEFTPVNLHKQIEEHMFEIVEEKFHSGDVYFRLLYKDDKYQSVCGTPGISTKEICDLFGPDYFNTLIENVNHIYMNPIMASLE